MVIEEERQKAKEEAIILALKKGMALIRDELKVYGIKVNRSKTFISESSDYDYLWQDALNKLKKLGDSK